MPFFARSSARTSPAGPDPTIIIYAIVRALDHLDPSTNLSNSHGHDVETVMKYANNVSFHCGQVLEKRESSVQMTEPWLTEYSSPFYLIICLGTTGV